MAGCASDDGDASDGDASDGDFLEAFAGRGAGDASSAVPSSAGPSSADAHSLYTSAFVNPKAGMDGVDTAHVRRVVDAMSRNSAHHRNETRKLEKVEARIREMRARFARLTPEQLARHQRRADARVATLERTRDVSRTWIHVDMDAFYAAVHVLENPELGRVPIAVGGVGMISTANYVARAFGVRSAMPGFIALKLCPDLTFVKPDFEKYRRYANLAREVFREYDPNFDAVSLDEAFLDVTEYLALNGVDANAAASESPPTRTALVLQSSPSRPPEPYPSTFKPPSLCSARILSIRAGASSMPSVRWMSPRVASVVAWVPEPRVRIPEPPRITDRER